jgi:hypothetical protein
MVTWFWMLEQNIMAAGVCGRGGCTWWIGSREQGRAWGPDITFKVMPPPSTSSSRPYLPNFLPPPKAASPARDWASNAWACRGYFIIKPLHSVLAPKSSQPSYNAKCIKPNSKISPNLTIPRLLKIQSFLRLKTNF